MGDEAVKIFQFKREVYTDIGPYPTDISFHNMKLCAVADREPPYMRFAGPVFNFGEAQHIFIERRTAFQVLNFDGIMVKGQFFYKGMYKTCRYKLSLA